MTAANLSAGELEFLVRMTRAERDRERERTSRLREFIEELDCECDGSPDGPGRCSRCTVLAMNGGAA